MKNRSQKSGLAPGALIYIGEAREHRPKIRCIQYKDSEIIESEYESWNAHILEVPKDTALWIDIDGIHDTALIEQVGASAGIHPLILEDLLNTAKRPKMDEIENSLFVLLKSCRPGSNGKGVITEQISLVLKPGLVITFQEKNSIDAFAGLRERLRNGKGKLRKLGVDYLVYALLDSTVDSYFNALETLGERIEQLEHEALTKPNEKTLAEIYKAKRVIMALRRAIWPLREILTKLSREDSECFTENTQLFLRDVYDHVIELVDILENYREMSATMMEIYLSGISNRMNNVMMLLAMVSTVFMPLSFIAGVYGMNFSDMPELSWKYGYPMALGVMASIAGCMLFIFRRRGWL